MNTDREGNIGRNELAEKFDIDPTVLDAMNRAGIITKVTVAASGYGIGFRESQIWKVEKALEIKQNFPDESWRQISRRIPKINPDTFDFS